MNIVRRRRTNEKVPTSVRLESPSVGELGEAQAFVWRAFQTAYGARRRHLMPQLMTLRDDEAHLVAVLGLCEPGADALFLEQYLEAPVEVGNFAVGEVGGGRWLITALTAYLYAVGKVWAVFTCGPGLQNAFRRLGIELVDLAAADPQRLPSEELDSWGSYYAQRPRVMAASVAQSHRVLVGLFGRECALNALWQHALNAGRLAA